jgi:hypothetical protein
VNRFDKYKEDKENADPNVNTSESFSKFKDHYTTPPFKSYKAKVPDKKSGGATTSYRSRSNAYNDSTRAFESDTNNSYIRTKNKNLDRLMLRREQSST